MDSWVDAKKGEANEAFRERRFQHACELYTEALERLRSGVTVTRGRGEEEDATSQVKTAIAVLLANRSFTRLKLEEYGFAISDATEAIAQDASYVKAYYRRGSANFALGKYKEAKSDLKVVERLAPGDKDAKSKLKECDRRVREQLFAEAIGVDHVSELDSVDLDQIGVEENYDGPRLSESPTVQDSIELCSARFCEELMETFKLQKKLHPRYVVLLLRQVRSIFLSLPTVVDLPVGVDQHITVCGDTHGQFYDLIKIFELNGLPTSSNPYLFNGDFVDRGSFSVEVILTLLAFKVHDPACMHLTRGNHETRGMNKIYGFEGEVKAKYSERTFEMFMEVFRAMPLAYVLDGSQVAGGKRAFVLHGGLFSKDGVSLDTLRSLDRNCEPDSGLLSEMLWSDPQKEPGRGPSKRGIGVSFGPDVTMRFLEENNLDLLVRSHEMKEEGYEVEAEGKLITIFSAPNYCDQMGNMGAFIRFRSDMKPIFTQFSASPHPDVRPMKYAGNLGMWGL
eukprot:CAMPEP_0184683738 /NCGR_PEP_ID=MMETSP0312-20130426/12397_1 /TAXON_ID=31354 /ORGANISM="Compsopogon coeruleus, Strain SAG 36.94" /LENGTH=507 /DNA_ID=CAMNT_0027136309 /DNA_START=154 /DNA_END=1677 /DNA_ORIENTATION=-